MNVPKEIIIATLQEIHTSFNITPNQIKITNYDDYMIVIWRDEYGYKEKLKIVFDEDFKRPDLVVSNQQFSYNNKLYQLLVIEQPLFKKKDEIIMTSIYDIVTKNENYTNIKNFQLDSHFDDELFLNHFLDPNDKRLDIDRKSTRLNSSH